MKRLLTAILFIFSLCVLSQEKSIEITPSGITQKVNVVDNNSINAYSKSLEYINKKYKNPGFVIKSNIENKLLRFSAYDYYRAKNSLSDTKLTYEVELEFKEGRYRISFYNVKFNNTYSVPKSLYNSKGELKKNKYYSSSHEQITILLNKCDQEILSFITSKEDW